MQVLPVLLGQATDSRIKTALLCLLHLPTAGEPLDVHQLSMSAARPFTPQKRSEQQPTTAADIEQRRALAACLAQLLPEAISDLHRLGALQQPATPDAAALPLAHTLKHLVHRLESDCVSPTLLP